MVDPQLQFGELHQKLGGALDSGMQRLRAQMLTYVEMLGLPPEQCAAFKQTVKAATTDFWSQYEKLLAAELEKFGTRKDV